jgi:hypothetical protein
VSSYHTAAQDFVIALVSNPFSSKGYWVVPAEPAGDVPQSPDPKPGWGRFGWEYDSWYGHFPARNTTGGVPGAPVVDPVTMSPALALGLQTYLLIESLLKSIDPTQLTIQQFVHDFGDTELKGYLDFLYGNYQLAVNGIVKTGLPSEDEILGMLWQITQVEGVSAHPSTNPSQPTSQSWGAPWPPVPTNPGPAFSGNGWAWNGRYGASLTYPQYGYYGNVAADQSGNNWYTPAYIVSVPDATNFISQWQQAGVLYDIGSDTYVSIESLRNWTIPWLQNKLILGRMARWKALYLFNGFDGVWSVLQAFQRITGFTEVPAAMMLTQDNTIASGDWSCRELCTVVLIQGNLLSGNGYVNTDNQFIIETPNPAGGAVSGHSVAGLADFLHNLAYGNWAGPPLFLPSPNPGPPRPLSLRSLLAGAAL